MKNNSVKIWNHVVHKMTLVTSSSKKRSDLKTPKIGTNLHAYVVHQDEWQSDGTTNLRHTLRLIRYYKSEIDRFRYTVAVRDDKCSGVIWNYCIARLRNVLSYSQAVLDIPQMQQYHYRFIPALCQIPPTLDKYLCHTFRDINGLKYAFYDIEQITKMFEEILMNIDTDGSHDELTTRIYLFTKEENTQDCTTTNNNNENEHENDSDNSQLDAQHDDLIDPIYVNIIPSRNEFEDQRQRRDLPLGLPLDPYRQNQSHRHHHHQQATPPQDKLNNKQSGASMTVYHSRAAMQGGADGKERMTRFLQRPRQGPTFEELIQHRDVMSPLSANSPIILPSHHPQHLPQSETTQINPDSPITTYRGKQISRPRKLIRAQELPYSASTSDLKTSYSNPNVGRQRDTILRKWTSMSVLSSVVVD